MPLCSSTSQGAPGSDTWEDQTQPSCLKCHKHQQAAYFCVTSVSSRACIARAVVCLSWLLENFHCIKNGGEKEECVNPTRQTRQSTSPQALALPHSRRRLPVVPLAATAGVSSALFFLGAGAFLTQVHGGTRRCASPLCLPSFSMLRQALQNGASHAPDAFAAAALAALIDAARGVPRDSGIRFST